MAPASSGPISASYSPGPDMAGACVLVEVTVPRDRLDPARAVPVSIYRKNADSASTLVANVIAGQ